MLPALSLIAEIKVKILSTSKKKDDGFLSSEKLLDDLDQEELHMRERDAVTNAQIVEASSNLVESMTKLLEELLVSHKSCSYRFRLEFLL